MNRHPDPLLERLRAANPVPAAAVKGLAGSPTAVELLELIVAERGPGSPPIPLTRARRRWHPAWAAAAAVVATIGILLTQLLPGGGQFASAAEALRATSVVAAEQPVPAEAPYRYTKVEATRAVTIEGSWMVLVPLTRETWVAEDGSGRIRVVAGDPVFPGPNDRAGWQAAGSPDLTANTFDETRDAGSLQWTDLDSLPSDLPALTEAVRQMATGSDAPANVRMLEVIGELLATPGASPELRAALYGVAANIAGVELVGDVKDPAGRPGLAVGIVSQDRGIRIRTTLVFDPETSELLARESVLLDRAPWVDAEPPFVLASTIYLSAGMMSSTELS